MPGITVRAAGLGSAVLRGHKLPSGVSLPSQEDSIAGVFRCYPRWKTRSPGMVHFLNRMLVGTNVRTGSLNDLRMLLRRRATLANQQLLLRFTLSWSALWSRFVRRHCDTRRDRIACRLHARH